MSDDGELINEELFDFSKPDQIVSVCWWLTYLLGGRVVVPTDSEFWDNNFPDDSKLVMRIEDGQLVMYAEQG